MNWEAIGSVGEVLGSFVVILSVVYLAAQIRQSNRHAEASTELAWIEGLNAIWDRWAAEPTTHAIRSGFEDFDALSKDDQVRFQMQVGALVNHCMAAEQLWRRDLLANETRDAAIGLLAGVLRTPGARAYWKLDSQASPVAPELMREIEAHAAEPWNELFPWWRPDSNEPRSP